MSRRHRQGPWPVLVALVLSAPLVAAEGSASDPATSFGLTEDPFLILALHLDRIVLTDALPAVLHPTGLLLPLGALAAALELPITVDPGAGRAGGWNLEQDRRFALDVDQGEVVVRGQRAPFAPDRAVVQDGDIYVAMALLESWFSWRFAVDRQRLIATITASDPLPIQQRQARELRRQRAGAQRPAASPFPQQSLPYGLSTWPAVDASLSLSLGVDGHGEASYQTDATFLARGDFLGLNAALSLRGSHSQDRPASLREARLRLERKDPEGQLLGFLKATEFLAGDIFTPQHSLVLPGGAGRGVTISSFPLERPSEFASTALRGDLLPGWEVELYRDGTLLGHQVAGSTHRYEFADIALFYGVNLLRLRFYGPFGQEREEVKRFVIGSDMIQPGRGHYRLTIVEQDTSLLSRRQPNTVHPGGRTGSEVISLAYERGLRRNLSLTGGLSRSIRIGRPTTSASFGLRTSIAGLLARLDLVSDLGSGWAGSTSLQTRLFKTQVSFEHSQFSGLQDGSQRLAATDDAVSNRSQLRLQRTFSVTSGTRFTASIAARREHRRSGRETLAIDQRLATRLGRFSLAHTLQIRSSRGDGASQGNSCQRSSAGQWLLSGRTGRFALRGSLDYQILPRSELSSASLSARWQTSRTLRLSAGLNQSLGEDALTNIAFGADWRLARFAVGANASLASDGAATAQLSISTSFGREPRQGRWRLHAAPLASQGLASARVFLDRDQDGRFSAGDQPLQDIRLSSSGAESAITDEEGIAFLTQLGAYRSADVGVILGSLTDPDWLPQRAGVRFNARPGRVALLDFPVIESGEIDGTVYLEQKRGAVALSQVEVELVDPEGRIVQRVRSAFDGFYLFARVALGRYAVRLAAGQVDQHRLIAPAECPVDLRGPGSIVSNVDFHIVSAPVPASAVAWTCPALKDR